MAAALSLIEAHRENAETYLGDEICQQKSLELLNEIDFPSGLLPMEDISEVGHDRNTGFVWLIQNKAKEHTFEAIGKTVSYDEVITAFVEKHRMKNITGVKSMELILWVQIGEIYIEEKSLEKISFKNPTTGISLTFPVSAFQLDEVKKINGEGFEVKEEISV